MPFRAATACEIYARPRAPSPSSNRSASNIASSSPANAADTGAEDRHEPAGGEGAQHLVVVILERRRGNADEGALLTEDGAVEGL